MTSNEAGSTVSRRSVVGGLLGGGAALGIGTATAVLGATPATADATSRPTSGDALSVRQAVGFLQTVTDAHRTSGPRLAQSYQDESGLTDIAFVYDNALAVIALLAAGDLGRARAIGDALVYAQTHDESRTTDKVRQAYHADTFENPNGTAHFGWEFGLTGSAVGDVCWSGIALAHLARRTRSVTYRDAAVRMANWVLTKKSTSGLGGYTFGETSGLEGHKSSEHNIDVYAFFRLLAVLTGDRGWVGHADHAGAFVESLWNRESSHFWTGSDDGATINDLASQVPLDVQTWSWLAAADRRYADALDWAANDLATTDTPARTNSAVPAGTRISGVGFGTGTLTADTTKPIDQYNPAPDSGAVWLEGTAQLALALATRRRSGDEDTAAGLLSQLGTAQRRLGLGQRFAARPAAGGIVAASSPLQTGFGFGYYPNLHTGATSWAILAALKVNPYRF